MRNSLTSGPADAVLNYGDPGDVLIVGDWVGNGTDTLTVRRGGTCYVENSISSGNADTVSSCGDPGDTGLVGDWDGSATNTLGVRRNGTYLIRNTLTSGPADRFFRDGNPGDTVFVGDWDGTDTLGVRRPIIPGDDRACSDFPNQRAAQQYFDSYYPCYGNISRLDADSDRIACKSRCG